MVEGAAVDMSCVDLAQAGIYVYGTADLQVTDALDADPLFCLPLECDASPAPGGTTPRT